MYYASENGKELSLSKAILKGLHLASLLEVAPLYILDLIAHAHNFRSFNELISERVGDIDYHTAGIGHLKDDYEKSFREVRRLAKNDFFLSQGLELRENALITMLASDQVDEVPLAALHDVYTSLCNNEENIEYYLHKRQCPAESDLLTLVEAKYQRWQNLNISIKGPYIGNFWYNDHMAGLAVYLIFRKDQDGGFKITIKEIDLLDYLEEKVHSTKLTDKYLNEYKELYISHQNRLVKAINPNHHIKLITTS
ncbi:hypothetical protein [Vibrio rotiferianus]|uniref:hypothetical protein n=1 Tax=Vibrio rotiferianus TaxID=190895 RepID=UPI00391C6847